MKDPVQTFVFNSSDCDSVILPKYADKIKGKEQEFCPRCECKHENRNTTVIKVCHLTEAYFNLALINMLNF